MKTNVFRHWTISSIRLWSLRGEKKTKWDLWLPWQCPAWRHFQPVVQGGRAQAETKSMPERLCIENSIICTVVHLSLWPIFKAGMQDELHEVRQRIGIYKRNNSQNARKYWYSDQKSPPCWKTGNEFICDSRRFTLE